MSDEIKQILAEVKLYTDGQEYTLVHLPPAAITPAAGILAEVGEAFSALIADKDEVTLILSSGAWEDCCARLPGHKAAGPFRLITFDLPLDIGLVGFMAAVSRALAEAGVSIIPLAAYERDHVLVPAEKFEAAWAALEALKGG